MERYKRILFILGSFLILSLVYWIWREDYQKYTCESEDNGASCAILGINHEEHHEFERALKYLERSCSLEYSLGCFRYSLLLSKQNRINEGLASMEKSCQLGYKEACKKIKSEK
jgi:TPR repeat protein